MRIAAYMGLKWFAALSFLLSFSVFSETAPDLVWRRDKTADARIENKSLTSVLARLSAVTGWKVYLQPGVSREVSVEFQNASQSEALRKLFGDISYALVPQNTGGAKLFVYETSLSAATTFIQPDRAARPKNWLANELIVSLAPGSKQDVDQLATE